MKQPLKLYLTPVVIARLYSKAKSCGETGRGCLSHYITRIANEPVAFLSDDIVKLLNKNNNKKEVRS